MFECEKVNPKTKNLFKIIKGNCKNCGRNKSQIFIKFLTRAENFIKKQNALFDIDQLCQIQLGVV